MVGRVRDAVSVCLDGSAGIGKVATMLFTTATQRDALYSMIR